MRLALVALSVVAATGVSTTTFAQTPNVEVTGGVQIDRAAEDLLVPGWSVDVALNAGARWGLVAETSGARDTKHDKDLDTRVRLMFYTVAGGVRWSPWPRRRVAAFVQLLAGAGRLSASARVRGTAIGESATALLVQPGGGVRVPLTRSLGWVTQVDYRRVAADEDVEAPSRREVRLAVMLRAAF